MKDQVVKIVVLVVGIIVLFWVARLLLSFTFNVLLPLAVIIIAGYIVYSIIKRRRI